MNNTFISSIKTKPATIWNPSRGKLLLTRDFPETITRNSPALRAVKTQVENAREKISKFREKENNVEVGTFVRVKMEKLFSNMRRIIKEGNTKNIVVWWSPTIFQIARVIRSTKLTLTRNRYILLDEYGNAVSTPKGTIKQFYLSDLLPVNENEKANPKDGKKKKNCRKKIKETTNGKKIH